MQEIKRNNREIKIAESFKYVRNKLVTNGSVKEVTERIKTAEKFY
jgi:hypothetical protein